MYGHVACLSSALHVATSLRIADALTDGPRNVSDLARANRVNGDAAYRVLRVLSSTGVFVENSTCHEKTGDS